MSSEPEKPTLECYAQWLTRFKQVCEVCNSSEFPKDKIIGYQLYLLDSGQFNANFVLEELLRLKYPLSPFIPTARHAYIRSSDTWAMELLSNDYRQANKKAKIVWLVDSGQFWSEFKRYTHCIPISSLNTPDLVESFLTTPSWITCENNEQQLKAATKCKHDIIMAFAEKEKPVLAPMFRTIIYLEKNAPEMTDDMKQALRDMFPSVPESEHPFQSYSKEVKDWLKRKIESKVPVAFYYKEKILERHALVICEWMGELQSFKSVLDNLGYRMDPIKAIRLVLRKFPGLFVCVDDTEKFFEEYYKTKVYKSLTKDEQQLIKELVISIKETIKNANGQLQLQLYNESGFTMIIERLLHYYQNVESQNELSIYLCFIEQCLKTISSNIEFSSSWFLNVAIPELTDVVESICTPSCQLAQVVRHTQRVSEVLLLYFETFQPEHLLSDIVTTKYFHDFPVQGVSLTPYAMRAFVRVFQLIDKYPNSSKPLRVSVTNQSYYEWLQDLERLDQDRISVFPVQYLDEAEPNSDVFFVEIHPNNVVATKQFAHDVIGLVGQLPERRSTLVIDITLNALNDSEVKGIISKALGLINSGHLNLILIQSLTKFSQLGLDKRSAGLIVMLNNNDKYWKGANEELKTLEQAEPVDVTTLKFFSYFHQCADDLRKYIEMINENTRPVQGVSLTPYAMRAFVRVFQLIDKYPNSSKPLRVSVTNQSYYEWLQDLERLDQHRISVFLVQYLDEAEPNSDVFFVEIHPNNVVATKQFAHDVIGLVGQLPERRNTLVIDITLNALNDSEVKGIISKALELIKSGHLNLILIQSLTKFSQLGLDKRSAGLIVMLNNNDEYWKGANEELKTLEQAEPVDVTTLQFFSYFHQCADDLRKYIEMINENTRHVYHSVMKQLDEMEVLSRKPFRLTLSSDPGACYIALNISGLIGIVNENFTLQENWMEQFLKDLLKHFIHPLCRLLKLPLTERMSIGFPLSSVNVVFDSLRITIGLESKADLDHYTDVLAYVAFVLNRIRIGRLELYTDATYRKEYFEEKVNLFSALHHLHFTPYEVIYYINTNQYRDCERARHFVERKVWIQNGTVNICHIAKICIRSLTEKTYDESHILVRVCGKEQALCDLTYPQKRMVLSCLTGIRSPKETTANYVYLNVEEIKIKQANLDSQHVKISATGEQIEFGSFQIVDNWDKIQIYGPFPPDNINFRLNNMTISALIGDNELNLPIYVKQGSMCFPLLEMPIEDREFLFAEGPYENNRTPIGNHMMVKKVNEEKIVIERDYICVSKPGFTVFQRFITDTTTYFEIDYWSIKDPLLARFMRLMTAVYIHKTDTNIGFGARDERLSHFLMNIDLGRRGKPLMTEATKVVYHRRDCLHKLLLQASMVENTYSFLQKSSNLRNCSRKSLVTYIGNAGLITAAYELLKPPSVPASLPAALPPGTGSPS